MKRFLLCSALCLGTACSSSPKDPETVGSWKEVELEAPTDHVLWQLTLLSIQNMGFPLGSELDPTSGRVQTGWKTELQPFRGEGTRSRAHLRLEPIEPGRWKVRARVEREQNMALAAPLDPQRAEWEAAGDDERMALVLLHHIQSRLDPKIELTPAAPDPLASGRKR